MSIEIINGFYKPLFATFVLDGNNHPELHIVFPNDMKFKFETKTEEAPDGGDRFYGEDHGVCRYGAHDANGKFWSSRPACFMDVLPMISACIETNYSTAIAITPAYYEQLKEWFGLYYDCKIMNSVNEPSYIYIEPRINNLVGYNFHHQEYGKCHVLNTHYNAYRDLIMECKTEEGPRFLKYSDVPGSFNGMSWEDYKAKREELTGRKI